MADMEQYLGRVRGLVIQVEEMLGPIDTHHAHHLIDHGEPPEGLRSLAWAIVEADKRIPRPVYDELVLLIGDMIDPRDLPPNLEAHISEGAFSCPVCGAAELSSKPYETWPPPVDLVLRPPYEDQLGGPSYEVCPNCGFEFGNDDNPGTASPLSFDEYRREWGAAGSPRFSG